MMTGSAPWSPSGPGVPGSSWVPPPIAPPAAPTRKPLSKKTWFLIGFGVSAIVIIGAVVAIVLATSTTSSPTNQEAARSGTDTNGFVRFTDHADAFGISVPPSWTEINPASPGANAALRQNLARYPKLKAVIGNGSLESSGMRFFAFDPGNTASNVNVVVTPAPGLSGSDLAQAVGELKSEYQQAGIGVSRTSVVHLDGHQALYLQLSFPGNAASTGQAQGTRGQYLLLANGFVYAVSIGGPSPHIHGILHSFSTSG
jgi:hypothetical protein